MRRDIYECDKCGTENNCKMESFDYVFELGGGIHRDRRTIHTGHLCPKCVNNFAETFFNKMVDWTKNK